MSFNNVAPGWLLEGLAEIREERSLVHQDAEAHPRIDTAGSATVAVTSTHRSDGTATSGTTVHLTLAAAEKLHRQLGRALKSHRVHQEITRA
ncbi:hypothetical protein ABZ714_12970 [Streptomyces sp. NPDC006798]|uniref:hypothetical protein n=1 Tax=Streptomyces sp. NPDC006798 TaxID=3155462 RepID=UPI0033E74571